MSLDSSQMKLNLKKRISRSLTFDNLDSLNINFEMLKNLDDLTFSSESTRNNSLNSFMLEPILSKNINCVDEVLKFIFIGDLNVGKTFLINKLLDDQSAPETYSPTNSFVIKKKNINLLEKRVKSEFWDTNVDIINSTLCEGKIKLIKFFN